MTEQNRVPGWVWVTLIVTALVSASCGLFFGGVGGYLIARRDSRAVCPYQRRCQPMPEMPGRPAVPIMPHRPDAIVPAPLEPERAPDTLEIAYGARVLSVVKGSPAEQAGLLRGDIITAVEGQPLSSEYDLTTSVRSYQPGDRVLLTIWRNVGAQSGREMTIRITLGETQTEEGGVVAYLGVTIVPAPIPFPMN